MQPGYWTLFVLEDSVSKYLKSRVDRYCAVYSDIEPIFTEFFEGIRFDQVKKKQSNFES